MVDEFDQIERRGKSRWLPMIFVNLLIWGLLGLAAFMWFTRQPVIEVKSIIATDIKQIAALQEGQIGRIHFAESEAFRAGQLLFNIEDPRLLTQIQKTSETILGIERDIADARSELAKSLREHDLTLNIESVKNDIRETSVSIDRELTVFLPAANEEIERQKAIYERYEKLVEAGIYKRSELEAKYLAVKAAIEARDAVLRRIEDARRRNRSLHQTLMLHEEHRNKLSESTDEEIRRLERDKADEVRTQADRFAQFEQLDYYAEEDGLVVERVKQEGEAVKFQDAVLRVTTGKRLWIEAYFLPENEYLVEPGDRVRVRYGIQQFSAIVRTKLLTIEPGYPGAPVGPLTPQRSYLRVILDFVDPAAARAAGLRPGLHVTTEVSQEQGLLYRLGIKRPSRRSATPGPEPTSPTRATDLPTTPTSE